MAEHLAGPPIFAGRRDAFGDKSPEAVVGLLADREQVRDITAIYAHRVTHGLSVADLFTDDGAYIQRRSPDEPALEVRGRAELDAHYIERPGFAGTATPMIHNHLIELDGDEARAICSIELRIQAERPIFASGYYQDRLRREDGRWKFVERRVTFFRWEEGGAAG